MVVKYSKFQSDTGFSTNNNIEISPDGRIVALSIDANEIKLGGNTLFVASESGTGALSLANGLTVLGDTSLTTGSINIFSNPVGAMDNVSIGAVVSAAGKFTDLTALNTVVFSAVGQDITISPLDSGSLTINPVETGNMDNVNVGTTVAAEGRFTAITLTQEATSGLQVPTKNYVDTRVSALAIALGS
jgi:hypothetical protein